MLMMIGGTDVNALLAASASSQVQSSSVSHSGPSGTAIFEIASFGHFDGTESRISPSRRRLPSSRMILLSLKNFFNRGMRDFLLSISPKRMPSSPHPS